MLIKMNHVAHLSDARYGAGMGVAWMGIACHPENKHYVSPQVFAEMAQWVVGPRFVAELSDFSSAAARKWLQTQGTNYTVEAIEIADRTLLKDIPKGMSFFYRQKIASVSDLCALPPLGRTSGYYVLAFEKDSWQVLQKEWLRFAKKQPVFLDVPLALSEVKALRGSLRGLAIDSQPEPRPGWQDYGFLAEVLELLNEAGAPVAKNPKRI